MEVTFQLLDADYILNNNSPTLRLFGKTKKGESVCAFFEGYFPYFYLLPNQPKEKIEEDLKKKFPGLIKSVREVERFLPIGYREEKEKLIQIYLTDPSKVPLVREHVINSNLAKEVFEADILFKYRFLADFNINGMRWYKVEGSAINTETVKVDKKVLISHIEEVDEIENAPFKVLALDIETLAKEGIPDPEKDQIIMISLAFSPPYNGYDNLVLIAKSAVAQNNTLIFTDEKEMLRKFIQIIDQYDPDIIVGYNINNFDLPFILRRLKKNNLSRALGRDSQKPATSKKLSSGYRNSIIGRIIVDVYTLIKELANRGFLKLKRYGLGDVSQFLLGDSKVDITHSEITKFWNGGEEKLSKLIEYSRKDSILALRLFSELRLIDKYIELSKVSGVLLQDILDGGESVRVEHLLLKEFNKRGYVIPEKPSEKEILKRKEMRETKGLKGALVLEPIVGLHKSIIYLDFKSMYPNIFISFNICPTTLVLQKSGNIKTNKTPYGTEFVSQDVKKGIIPKILENLINERDKVKKQMKEETNPERKLLLDAKQEALKRMANAFYGYTGYVRARFYILDIANSITSCGRYFIQTTKELVEKNKNYQVIYGDTDSIMVKANTEDIEEAFKIGKEIEETVNKYFSGKIEIKIESIFKTFLIISKKRYAGISVEKSNDGYKEKLVMKGIETVRKDWCDLTGEVLMKVLEILLKEGDARKALKYVQDVIIKLQKGDIPIEKLVITKSISKPLDKYKGVQPHVELVKKMKKRSPAEAPGIGDRVSFVIVQGPELVSKRAEDPRYVLEHGLKIDSKYYIESQVLPPIERVFEVLGISKSQLMNLGRQMGLVDIVQKQSSNNFVESLSDFDGFVCLKCGKKHQSLPLSGKCYECGSEIVFFKGEQKARVISLP